MPDGAAGARMERKFDRIAAEIRRQVLAGAYRERIPGERELAEQYQVHVLTANKAVTSLVEEGLLYRVKGRGTFVTRLKRARTGTLAAVVGDVLAPLHAKIVRGMEAAARRAGQHILFCNRYDDEGREEEFVSQILAQEKADGFLVWPTTLDLASPGMRRLRESGIPFVLFPHADPTLAGRASHVVSDDRGGAALAVRHLVELGHRRIRVILPPDWPESYVPAANRLAGYADALSEAGLHPLPPLAWQGHAAELQREGATALFCATDNLAVDVLKALRAAGVSVPQGVSLCGFDDTPRAADFGLTTVEQPMEAIGARAVELLLEEIEGRRREPAHAALQGRLVVRATTRARRVR